MPKVGIFFVVNEEIIMDAVPVEESEPYGDAVQYGSHAEFWEMLTPKTLPEWKFKARAYDAYPRGRVVFFPKEKKYIVYVDKCITSEELNLIKEKFGLTGLSKNKFKISIDNDLHYKCAKCNPHFLD